MTTPNAKPQPAEQSQLLTTVPVRKPSKQDFVGVHPSVDYRLDAALIVLKDDRDTYLVPPPIARELPGEYVLATIYAGINRQGVVFLWYPVRYRARRSFPAKLQRMA
jgi:23S rRNA A2030 N6-methylase RlmJ